MKSSLKYLVAASVLAGVTVNAADNKELILKPSKEAQAPTQPQEDFIDPAMKALGKKSMLPDEKVMTQRRSPKTEGLSADMKAKDPAAVIPAASASKPDTATPEPNAAPQADTAPPKADADEKQTVAKSDESDGEDDSESSKPKEKKLPPQPVITPKDLLVDQKGIPESPAWLKELQRQDVQHLFERRALEREAELAKIRATIAEADSSARKARDGDKKKEDKPAAMAGQMFGAQPLPQFISDSPGGGGMRMPAMPPPPPPAPMPPTVSRIMGDFAVANYDSNQYTVKRGDSIPGGYVVTGITFDAVTFSDGKGAQIRVSPQW